MIQLGIITLTPDQPSSYFNELAGLSPDSGVSVYLFSPLHIQPGSENVSGYRFHQGTNQWIHDSFSIPSFLYDRCLYGETKESKDAKAIVSWLKAREDITFLGYGLPNKWSLYEKLIPASDISPYLPITRKVSSPEQIVDAAIKYKEVIIKPINGAHGFAVYLIEYDQHILTIKTTKNGKLVSRTVSDPKDAIPFFEKLLLKHIFILQPRLNNLNESGHPFDLRVFLQKDENGKWMERARGIRTGQKDGILTNLSAGADIISFEEWKNSVSNYNIPFIDNEINEVLDKLPHILEKQFYPLFELGIDLIIAKDHSIWIIDMNSKPGRKLVAMTNPQELETLYKAPLSYCKFLANNKAVNFEKTK
ncbi:YheC/YheD family endospore coat-associated protein [Falsibacillus albus]|uniref:YheC/YheD family protein n=1 Tax=Falsibacillus albus TaxID=2478915 RepID=A0A3L7K3V1_9BACI|nr:YheC/YheD family protein [Falsibacillus albus]RLQ97315.1 YheC/YheD family protein [Falsibacillus albus]